MNNNIFQHNSSCVLGVTFSLTLEKAMVGDLGESLCLKKYWFCSLRKETLVSYYKFKIALYNLSLICKIRKLSHSRPAQNDYVSSCVHSLRLLKSNL